MNTESNSGWKVIIAVVVIAVLAAVFFLVRSGVTPLPEPVEPAPAPTTVSSVDDVEGALLNASVEEAMLLDETSDAELLGSDSEALDNVGKSYDEQNL